jgi:hypothetical protein
MRLSDPNDMRAWLGAIYAEAARLPDELARASVALLGVGPSEADIPDLLAFVGLEWVDASGRTAIERLVARGALPAAAMAWSWDVRTALWVVDGVEGDRLALRDLATDDEVVVRSGTAAELAPRSVLRARLVPDPAHVDAPWSFVGQPDVWSPRGVIGRLELLRQWREGPEPELLGRMRELRAAFRRQREEREVFVAHFGADMIVCRDAADLETRLAGFVNVLLNGHRFASLGGRTRAEAHTAARGDDPVVVQFALGPTLTGPGRPGVIYDDVEGVHFLPRLGEFLAHLHGDADHPDVVREYLDEPGISWLPFLRAGDGAARPLAMLLGVPDAPLDALLELGKGPARRAAPSVLPGFED